MRTHRHLDDRLTLSTIILVSSAIVAAIPLRLRFSLLVNMRTPRLSQLFVLVTIIAMRLNRAIGQYCSDLCNQQCQAAHSLCLYGGLSQATQPSQPRTPCSY
jgi:hypothetical protein